MAASDNSASAHAMRPQVVASASAPVRPEPSWPYRRVVLRQLRGLPDYRRLRFLELSCGDAEILEHLRADGAAVRGTTFRKVDEDYIREREYPPGLQIDEAVDLNKPLPYESGAFDVVFSTEVLEHVELHRVMISEASRVLRSGGWFVLSGIHHVKRELPPWSQPLDRMEEYHHHCADFPLLHWLLWKNDLRIRRLHITQVNPLSYPLLAVWPMNWLVSRLIVGMRSRNTDEDAQARSDLLHWMNSPRLLLSEQICLVAQKTCDGIRNDTP
jgi:SAM-dependent methyltransferase